ncbi:MAG: ATP synthase F1 subunit delta [Ignavibacteria bacterium]|nr:ATP synthase F1 subunit delta [Ignavibacteria bacterium]
MSTLKIARRYAKAILETAVERKIADEVEKDMEYFGQVGDSSKDLRAMLRSPIIDVSVKKQVVRDIFSAKLNPLTLDFMMLILDKGRGHLWREIVMEYGAMLDDVKNIERIRVTSAVDLADPERGQLEKTLAHRLNKTVIATYDVDPTILGGAVVRVGDEVLDGSLRHQLSVLKEKLANA